MIRPRTRSAVLLAALCVSLLATAVPVAAAPAFADQGLRVALRAMRHLAVAGEPRATERPREGLPIDLGRDGRLTVLLLGSDWRPGVIGERTDVVMVGSIDPTTGEASVVSIPRDMASIPLANGGDSGSIRVNSIYWFRHRRPSLGARAVDRRGLTRFKRDISAFLGVEIDYWAFVRFGSFSSVINKLGGVYVEVREAVHDPSYHHGPSRGVWFPKAKRYLMKGNKQCRPRPRKCRAALVYARSRKGTVGRTFNSDYRRAERQQQIVLAGIRRVLEDHGSGLMLLGVLGGVRQYVVTDMPATPEAAAQLYDILKGVRLRRRDMEVLSPPRFGVEAADFSIRPNVAAIRRWVGRAFRPVRQRAPD